MMKFLFLIICLATSSLNGSFPKQNDFKSEQKKFSRVRTAYSEKENKISYKLSAAKVDVADLNVLLVAYKAEEELELWIKSKSDEQYKLLETYNVCNSSGKLGPKRKQGDYQVPEGFYYVDRFNPSSNFYLSLGINYPNQADKLKSTFQNLGGDIFIHGECVTVGCLPMTNDKIKEIYLYALEAKNNGQKRIPVYIFPTRLTEKNFSNLKSSYSGNGELIPFWSSLKSGYDQFLSSKKEISYTVGIKGDYEVR